MHISKFRTIFSTKFLLIRISIIYPGRFKSKTNFPKTEIKSNDFYNVCSFNLF